MHMAFAQHDDGVDRAKADKKALDKCMSVDPDAKIAGCTALLKADQYSTKNRALSYGNRAVGYYSKGNYDLAIQDTDQAIRLNPNEPSFYYTSGLAYKKKGDFDRAIQDFNEAIHLEPKISTELTTTAVMPT